MNEIRPEQIDARNRERMAVALERIADSLDGIRGHLLTIADYPDGADALRRIARAAEHATGLQTGRIHRLNAPPPRSPPFAGARGRSSTDSGRFRVLANPIDTDSPRIHWAFCA